MQMLKKEELILLLRLVRSYIVCHPLTLLHCFEAPISRPWLLLCQCQTFLVLVFSSSFTNSAVI